MKKNCSNFMFNNFIICLTIFLASTTQIHSGAMCVHCDGPIHRSKNERCEKCKQMIEDCAFEHDIITSIPPLSVEDIVNASDPNSLTDILIKLMDMYKVATGRSLTPREIFKKGDEIFKEHGIVLPKRGYDKMKDDLERRDHREYITRNSYSLTTKDRDENENFSELHLLAMTSVDNDYGMHLIAKATVDNDDGLSYPLRLKCGVLLTWCGATMTVLSEGILAPAGIWVASLGAAITIEGMIDYQDQVDERARQRLEETRKKAEKDERSRLKAIEKQKEKEEKVERRRLKDERLRLQEQKK